MLLVSLIALASLMLSGCIGGGCGGTDYGTGNRTSAGNYSGTYTNTVAIGTSGAAKDLILTLAVTDQGDITGTASEPSSGQTATVTGHVSDWFSSCSSDTTILTLDLAFSGGSNRSLGTTRSRGDLTDFTRVVTVYTQGRGDDRAGSDRADEDRLLKHENVRENV